MTKLTKEQILSIATMRGEGKTNGEIAAILGVSRTTISYWVQRLKESGHEIKRFRRGGRKAMKI